MVRWALVPVTLMCVLVVHRIIAGRRMIRAMRAYDDPELSDLDWSDR